MRVEIQIADLYDPTGTAWKIYGSIQICVGPFWILGGSGGEYLELFRHA